MSIENFNLDDFRLKPSLQGTPVAAKLDQTTSTSSEPDKSWFLRGPIPGEWLSMAAELPGKALHVGMAIWYLKGLTKRDSVKVTSKTRKKFSLRRDAYLRGLEQLEKAGLVRVERKPGACAEIILESAPQSLSSP